VNRGKARILKEVFKVFNLHSFGETEECDKIGHDKR
jgi:hypothetical protein